MVASIGCDSTSNATYDRLKTETGASSEELENGIKLYTDFYIRMREEIDAGTLTVDDMIVNAKRAKEVMSTVHREDEMAALTTLTNLRTLEIEGSSIAADQMVSQLNRFLDANRPDTESARKIISRINEYAETSAAFSTQKQYSEQGAAANP